MPGADLGRLAGLHHGVRAGGGLELGVARPILGHHTGSKRAPAEVGGGAEGGVAGCRGPATEAEGRVLLLLLVSSEE